MNNGRGNGGGSGRIPGFDPAAMAAMQAGRGPVPPQAGQAMDPVKLFLEFFGLSVPAAQALGINVVPCVCGRCQGVGVQAEARMHFPIVGPPEIIRRGDAPRPPTPEGTTGTPPTGGEGKSA